MTAYRYWRWRVTKRRNADQGPCQASEFNLMASGSRLTGATVTGLGVGYFDIPNESVSKLDDNSTGDKYQTTVAGLEAVWDFGSPVTPDAYRWYTANDDSTRDPVSWTLSASSDGQWWNVVDAQTDYAVTSSRTTLVNTWSITPPADAGAPSRTGVSYRYIRFTPSAVYSGGTTIVYSEFNMLSMGERIPSSSQTGPAAPGSDGPNQVDNWGLATKLTQTSIANGQVVLDFGSTQTFDAYRVYSAESNNGGCPVSWTVEGSPDNSAWTLLDTQTSYGFVNDQQAILGPFNLSFAAATVTPKLIVPTVAVQRAASW